jgi:Tol biopolymer transport system component/DNA-binding winged helix-turn-helix (wHTH) protein
MEKHLFEFGEFRLESPGGDLYWQHDRVPLSPKASRILLVLVGSDGRVVLKDDLMKAVWPDTFVEEGNLTFHIHAIRKALSRGEENRNDRYIETVPRRGYRFLSPVRRVTSETPEPPLPAAPPAMRAKAPWIGVLLFSVVILAAMRLTIRPNRAEPDVVRLTNNVADDTQPDISPDGGSIVFVSNRDGGKGQIYVMDADGSNPRNLSNNPAFGDDTPSWSPDGRRIAFQSKRRGGPSEIYVMNADGSHATPLVEGARAAWSPDGKFLAYEAGVDGHREVFVIPGAGGNARRLTFDHDYAGSPSWSPDGARILFTVAVDHKLQLATMRPDGTDRVILTSDASNNRLGVFSPDGRRIVFNSDRDGPDSIFLMDSDGALQRRITDGKFLDDEASWSRDGRFLFFESERDGNREIYRMRAPAAPDGATRLTRNVASDAEPAWSPDGQWIAFDSNREGSAHIFVMDTAGGHVRSLTHGSSNDTSPDWSPDGRQIAFVSNREGAPGIFVIQPDGSAVRRIVSNAWWPKWSPDASRICFSRDHSIWTADASGGGEHRVAAGESCTWSNDGNSLVFDRDDYGFREIFRVPRVGGDPRMLTRGGKVNGGPAWSAAAGRIAFNSNRDGAGFSLYVIREDGSGLIRVTGRGVFDLQPSWSPDGRWIAFTSRRDGNEEIYKVAAP